MLPEGVLLSGEMHETQPFEIIPPSLKVERDGEIVQDTFIGEQTLIANVKDRGLVVVTSCSHRGIVGICRHAVPLPESPRSTPSSAASISPAWRASASRRWSTPSALSAWTT